MMTKQFWTAALLTLGSYTSLQAQEQNYVELHYNFAANQQFELNMESRSETYMTVNDVMQRTTRDFNGKMNVTVSSANRDVTVLTWKYQDIRFNYNSKNVNALVDARIANDKEPLTAALAKIVDKPFTVEIQPTGIINKVDDLDALIREASTAFASLKEDDKKAYEKLLADQFGTQAFRSWLEQLLVIYPAHGIKTGTQWEESVPLRTGLVGRTDLYWNLQTWDSQTAKIAGTAKIKTDKLEVLTLDDDIKATAEINGDMQSNYLINRESGLPSICIQTTEMKGDYTYQINKKKRIKNEIKVPVKVITNASYKFKQIK
ncbi:DUF6263 family protein [Chitinophaga horti]|uniref:DUF6263 family protein n=1 Tax=Chitinophaga horti TaxID=2920382 RepID=A0ABY6IZ37_9BACT|nr:DUF6263 family protein [Chitinophaga horti]UYQ92545.1 DUF6263 family protein [Chitinophaga horti]